MPAPHPKEFRDDVVALARQGELPIAQLAKDFGISESCLRNWLKTADVEDGNSLLDLKPSTLYATAHTTATHPDPYDLDLATLGTDTLALLEQVVPEAAVTAPPTHLIVTSMIGSAQLLRLAFGHKVATAPLPYIASLHAVSAELAALLANQPDHPRIFTHVLDEPLTDEQALVLSATWTTHTRLSALVDTVRAATT